MKTILAITSFIFLTTYSFSQHELDIDHGTETADTFSEDCATNFNNYEQEIVLSMDEDMKKQTRIKTNFQRSIKEKYSSHQKPQKKLSKKVKRTVLFAGMGIIASILLALLFAALGIALLIGLLILYLYINPAW